MTLSKPLKITQIMVMLCDSSSTPLGWIPDVLVHACLSVCAQWMVCKLQPISNTRLKTKKGCKQTFCIKLLFCVWMYLAFLDSFWCSFLLFVDKKIKSLICPDGKCKNSGESLGPNTKVIGLSPFHDVFLRHKGEQRYKLWSAEGGKQGKLKNLGRRGRMQM